MASSAISFSRWTSIEAKRRLKIAPTEAAPTIAPFPAGLNDCFTGLEWLDANRAELGIGAVCVAGESGGGNLAIATALKAKREGKLALLPSGVFALCPYIAGTWPQDVRAPSIPLSLATRRVVSGVGSAGALQISKLVCE